MLSKFLQPCARLLCARGPKYQVIKRTRLIPASQYDMDIPVKLHVSHALRVYWELIPLFIVNGVAIFILFASIVSCCINKVDVVFSTNNRRNISRTMDLRSPTVHKLVIINQRYEPWPEMQSVLEKMKEQERLLKLKLEVCAKAGK